MRSSIIIPLLLLVSYASAQTFTISYGGDSSDYLGALKRTPDGGHLMVGSTTSYGDLPNIYYKNTGFIVKADANGQHEWSFILGDTNSVVYTDAALRDDGGYFVVGMTQYTSTDPRRLVLVNLGSDGVVNMIKVMRVTPWEPQLFPSRILALGGDEYLIIGEFVTSGAGTGWNSQQFAMRIDGAGDVIWTSVLGVSGWMNWSMARDVVKLPDGGFLLAGIRNFMEGIQVVKLDGQGVFQWDRTYASDTLFTDVAMKATQNGIFLLATHTDGTVLMKMDINAGIQWQKLYQHQLHLRALTLDIRDNGDIVFVSVISDTGVPVRPVLVRTDSEGELLSATLYGTQETSIWVADLIAESDGSITFGYSNDGTWFGAIDSQMHLVRMSADGDGYWSMCDHEPATLAVIDLPNLPHTSVMSQQPVFSLLITGMDWTAVAVGDTEPLCGTVDLQVQSADTDTYLPYPNPNRGSFTVTGSGGQEILDIEIFDASGRLIFRDRRSTDQSISLSDLASGIYGCKLTDGEGVEYKRKLIIQ